MNITIGCIMTLKSIHIFEFETRKKLITILKELAKLKNYDNESQLLKGIASFDAFSNLITDLIQSSLLYHDVLGCAGQILKFFAKQKVPR